MAKVSKDYDDDEKEVASKRSTKEVVTAETTLVGGLPADAYLTEQEKNPTGDPTTPPVDPMPAEVLDIPTKQPYPTAEG